MGQILIKQTFFFEGMINNDMKRQQSNTTTCKTSGSVCSKPTKFRSQEQFSMQYLHFVINQPNYEIVKNRISYIYQMYMAVSQSGGFIQALAHNYLLSIFSSLCSDHCTFHQFMNDYQRNVLPFEIYAKTNQLYDRTQLQALAMVRIITDMNSLFNDESDMFMQDMVLVKKFTQHLEILPEKVCVSRLVALYGDEKVEVEGREESGNHTHKTVMKLSDFLQLYRSGWSRGYSQELKHCQSFCVNSFVPPDETVLDEIYRGVANTALCYKGSFDFLSYLDEDIPGVTFPHFSILTSLQLTPLRQDPLGLTIININHGPDVLEWFCVPQEQASNLFKVAHEKYKYDIYSKEGIYFEKIDWFLENCIRVKKIVQEPGDAIFIGPGTVYWYRGTGKALCCWWKLMVKCKHQISISYMRYTQQKSVGVLQSSAQKIGLKALILRILNHEGPTINGELGKLLVDCYRHFLNEEEKNLNQTIVKANIGSQKMIYYPLYDGSAICHHCKQQIFVYFGKADGICCLQCFKNNKKIQKQPENLYFRFEPFYLHQLLAMALKKNRLQFDTLCRKQCIGEIKNCKSSQQDEEKKVLSQKQFQEIQQKMIKQDAGLEQILRLMEGKEEQDSEKKDYVEIAIQTEASSFEKEVEKQKDESEIVNGIKGKQALQLNKEVQESSEMRQKSADQQQVEAVLRFHRSYDDGNPYREGRRKNNYKKNKLNESGQSIDHLRVKLEPQRENEDNLRVKVQKQKEYEECKNYKNKNMKNHNTSGEEEKYGQPKKKVKSSNPYKKFPSPQEVSFEVEKKSTRRKDQKS